MNVIFPSAAEVPVATVSSPSFTVNLNPDRSIVAGLFLIVLLPLSSSSPFAAYVFTNSTVDVLSLTISPLVVSSLGLVLV